MLFNYVRYPFHQELEMTCHSCFWFEDFLLVPWCDLTICKLKVDHLDLIPPKVWKQWLKNANDQQIPPDGNIAWCVLNKKSHVKNRSSTSNLPLRSSGESYNPTPSAIFATWGHARDGGKPCNFLSRCVHTGGSLTGIFFFFWGGVGRVWMVLVILWIFGHW